MGGRGEGEGERRKRGRKIEGKVRVSGKDGRNGRERENRKERKERERSKSTSASCTCSEHVSSSSYPLHKQRVLCHSLHRLQEETTEGKSPSTGILGTLLFKFSEEWVGGLVL